MYSYGQDHYKDHPPYKDHKMLLTNLQTLILVNFRFIRIKYCDSIVFTLEELKHLEQHTQVTFTREIHH